MRVEETGIADIVQTDDDHRVLVLAGEMGVQAFEEVIHGVGGSM